MEAIDEHVIHGAVFLETTFARTLKKQSQEENSACKTGSNSHPKKKDWHVILLGTCCKMHFSFQKKTADPVQMFPEE